MPELKALHDPQNCPHCRKSISPILVGRIPQTYGAFVSNATCPECGEKWLTQLDTTGEQKNDKT